MMRTTPGTGGQVTSARPHVATATRLAIALSIALVPTGPSVARQPGDRFAYDNCYNIWTEIGKAVRCDIYVFDPGGSGYVYAVGSHVDPSLSPDGSHLAFMDGSQLAVVNLLTGDGSIVFDNPDVWVGSPTWSADGRIAFSGFRGGTLELNVMNANGTSLRQITTAVGFRGRPSWSTDGRIAFECEIEVGNLDICAIHADGTGYARLTHTALRDEGAPVFSPDGTRIAFSDGSSLSILNADGSVIDLGVSGAGHVWSPDATRLVYYKSTHASGCDADGSLCGYAEIYAVNLDGTGVTRLAFGANPSLARSTGGLPAFGYFTATCTTLACTFDASLSTGEGSIVRYEWDFGDGTTGTGQTPIHSYASAGSYAVNLTVVYDSGARASWRRALTVSEFPIASFTVQCDGLSCVFNGTGSYDPDGIATYAWNFGDGDGSSGDGVSHRYVSTGTYPVTLTVFDHTGAIGIATTDLTVTNRRPVASIQFSCDSLRCNFTASPSSDADGTIVSYSWSFGDGTQAADVSPIHMFAAAGTYSVVLTVTDDSGDTGTAAITVTVTPRVTHVGDLDTAKTVRNQSWDAFFTVTVHDAAHQPVANAFVVGVWSTGNGGCTTNNLGACTIALLGLANSTSSMTFEVYHVYSGAATYSAAGNHDPEGETDGTRVTIRRK